MARYILSPAAERDLDRIQEHYIRTAGTRVARRVLRELRRNMRLLAATPGAGHLRQDLTDAPLKFWPVFSFLIIYSDDEQPITITRILHGARDVQSLLN